MLVLKKIIQQHFRFLCECPVCASEESEIEEAEKNTETMDEKKTEKKDNDAAADVETVEKKREDLEEEGDKKESTTIEGLQAA